MATLEQLGAALVKADAAGNVADAKALAMEIKRMRSEAPTITNAPDARENVVAEPADARREMVQRELTTAIAPFAGAYTGVGNIVLGGQKLLGKGLTALGAKDTGQFLTEDAIRRQELQKQFIQPYKDVAPGYAGKIGRAHV